MPKTLTLGSGDQFDFVCIPASSNHGAYDLLTTQSEEEPSYAYAGKYGTQPVVNLSPRKGAFKGR